METLSGATVAAKQERVASEPKPTSFLRQVLRYVLHVVAVYVIVWNGTPWLSGWLYRTVLPLIQHHPPTASPFEFLFSHLFALSFFPVLVVGFIHSEWFRHRVAMLLWIVPAAILAYQFATFPTSIFQNHFAAAFHEYFEGGFVIPEWHSWEEFWRFIVPNPDFIRGMHQKNYTAPLYASVGYGIGTWLGIHVRYPKLDAVLQRIKPSWRHPKTL